MANFISTDCLSLDRLIKGFMPGKMVLIASRPGVGKTSLALELSLNSTKATSGKVLYYSLELTTQTLKQRLSEINGSHTAACDNFVINDSAKTTIEDIRKDCEDFHIKSQNAIIVIDFYGLMNWPKSPDLREQRISDFSRQLKILAEDFGCTVIVLSQLKRDLESRKDRRPEISDIPDSSALADDCDIIMLLYRASYYDLDIEQEDITELLIRKNLFGGCGVALVKWDKRIHAYTDI